MRKNLILISGIMVLTACQHQQIHDHDVFQKITEAHKQYGSSPQDWPQHEFRTLQIQPDVILAPLYSPKMFEPYVTSVKSVAKGRFPVYELLTKNGKKISFITVGVGGCNTLDAVLALAGTNCKTILFVGAVGSLTEKAKMGDLIIPKASVSGCGADTYLTSGSFLKNKTLGKVFKADEKSQEKLFQLAQKYKSVKVHESQVFSIDTVLGEYHHLPEILSTKSQAIEMETATLFHTSQITGRRSVALLYVSDCTFEGKSLYNGRSKEDMAQKEKTKKEIIPQLILSFFES